MWACPPRNEAMNPLRMWLEETFENFGVPGIFMLAFFDSSFLSLPEVNDLVLFVKCSGAGWLAVAYGLAATLGSALGCSMLYLIGSRGGKDFLRRRLATRYDAVHKVVERYGVYTVLIPSVLPPPLPFKIFVLAAGVFGIPYRSFLRTVLLGRSIRYFSEALAAALIGEPALDFFTAHPYTIAAMVVAVLGVGVAAQFSLKWLLRRRGVLDATD